MKQNPVLGALMQAEVYRHQGDYKKAPPAAQSPAQKMLSKLWGSSTSGSDRTGNLGRLDSSTFKSVIP